MIGQIKSFFQKRKIKNKYTNKVWMYVNNNDIFNIYYSMLGEDNRIIRYIVDSNYNQSNGKYLNYTSGVKFKSKVPKRIDSLDNLWWVTNFLEKFESYSNENACLVSNDDEVSILLRMVQYFINVVDDRLQAIIRMASRSHINISDVYFKQNTHNLNVYGVFLEDIKIIELELVSDGFLTCQVNSSGYMKFSKNHTYQRERKSWKKSKICFEDMVLLISDNLFTAFQKDFKEKINL